MSSRLRQTAGPSESGFDFTAHMRRLCLDIVSRLPELRHVDLDRVLITFSQARKRVDHGLHATLTPMRFDDGELVGRRGRRRYTVQRLFDADGREFLYILSFYLPRFLDTSWREKLVTVLHELWHINPEFNGDLRRFPGRCYAHSHSQQQYDQHVEQLVDRWLAFQPPGELSEFLRYSFDQLQSRHGRIYGVKISRPKLLPK